MTNKNSAARATQTIPRTTITKALEINQDPKIYGAFAEIGAGQEVARFFFTAGQASQTIAKTMSAYDMIYSDEIYGKETSGRYVCESRLIKMLDKEFSLLVRRLDKTRGDSTQFFAFANTVATNNTSLSSGGRQSHGWMGIRFQAKPRGEWNEIVMHVRALDKYRLMQQESLGILGVNLVHLAFKGTSNTSEIVANLTENLKAGQVAIDMLRFSGPDLKKINNHLLSLELVRRGLSEAVLFGPKGEILDISDTLFNRALVIERGHFRPVTLAHMEILEKGLNQFTKDHSNEKAPLALFEMTMNTIMIKGEFDENDFLDRVKAIAAVGKHVMVSNFFLFYRLKRFLRMYTKAPLGLLVGATLLDKMLDEAHYRDLEGGILEGLGKLFDEKTTLYVYPTDKGASLQNYSPPEKMAALFNYFMANKSMKDIEFTGTSSKSLIHSGKVHEMLIKKNSDWEKYVPTEVKKLIKSENLFSGK